MLTARIAAALVVHAAVAAPQQVVPQRPIVIDGNQQMVLGKVEPKLPSDAELARVQVPAELLRLARALDAEAFTDRESARTAIVARKPTPDELMALLLRTDLGDEARHQLVTLLRDRILHAPRGALGIRMENAVGPDGGVRIIGLVQGMPAEKTLKLGDVLLQVNDSPLRSTADLVNAVQSLQPGVEVKVVLHRMRKDALAAVAPAGVADPGALFDEVTTTMRLGSTDELNEKSDPQILNNGVAQIAGGVNFITFERVASANAAAKRFLPAPRQVEFPARSTAVEEKREVTVDSVRKLLMELQLAEGDPDIVRIQRQRLDLIADQLGRAQDPDTRARFQRALEALETEIRGAF